MKLLKIFLVIKPNGTYKEFVAWFKNLSDLDKAIYTYNINLLERV